MTASWWTVVSSENIWVFFVLFFNSVYNLPNRFDNITTTVNVSSFGSYYNLQIPIQIHRLYLYFLYLNWQTISAESAGGTFFSGSKENRWILVLLLSFKASYFLDKLCQMFVKKMAIPPNPLWYVSNSSYSTA